MPYEIVHDTENPPLPFVEAFGSDTDAAVQSQAACLLLLGNQQRDDFAGFDARQAVSGFGGLADAGPVEDVQRLDVPLVRPTGFRYETEPVLHELSGRSDESVGTLASMAEDGLGTPDALLPQEVFHDLAREVRTEPRPDRLAVLLEACLRHPDDLVRIAAAIAYQTLAAEPLRLVPVLVGGLRHEEPWLRELAATGLARFAPDHPALAGLTGGGEPFPLGAGETSLLVHGTWARDSDWWQPGGDFHTYLKNDVPRFSDLYDGEDRFDWSGGYSDGARAAGAEDLLDWVQSKDEQGLTLLGHSHGANVMMLASQQGLESELMVLLSCPVHRHKYWPDFNRVDRVVSVRVKADLVIWADGGGQRFSDPRIEENRLPIWFRHSASHSPEVWRRHDVPSLI